MKKKIEIFACLSVSDRRAGLTRLTLIQEVQGSIPGYTADNFLQV